MSNPYYKDIEYKEKSRKVAYCGKRIKVEEIEYLKLVLLVLLFE